MSNNYGTASIKYKTSAHDLITNDLPCSQSQINKWERIKKKEEVRNGIFARLNYCFRF